MSRLLSAGFYRLRKNVGLFVCIAVVIAYIFVTYISRYRNIVKFAYKAVFDKFTVFNFVVITAAFVFAVFTSLYVGTEYSDGTIRNKLVVGHSRRNVYLSNYVLCAAGAAFITLTGYLVSLVLGSCLFGLPALPLPELLLTMVHGLIIGFAYVSLFNAVAMVCSNKTYASIACIFLTFFILMATAIVYQKLNAPEFLQQAVMAGEGEEIVMETEMVLETVPNPEYLTGSSRTFYQVLLDILPGGQAQQIGGENIAHLLRMMAYSLGIILVSNGVGLVFFRKKNIK